MSEEDVIPETGAVFTYGKSGFADNIPSHFFIRNDPVIEISCGEEHSGIVCKNGRVFCFGKNSFGQLGLGHTENVYKPNCVKSLKPDKVNHIACGRSHTIVSTENNTVYGFGDNSDGQLGHSADISNTIVPVRVTKFNDKIIQIAAGSYHTAVLLENGDVYVWGSNSDGQLGVDASDDCVNVVRTPTIVSILRPVVHVSCGHGHTAFVTKTGDLFTCGDREYGKLGHDSWSLGQVETAEKIVQVACGANHTIALNDAGKVFVCGNNDCGQIGLRNVTSQGHLYPCPITNERIVQVTCGESHSGFITASGKLFTCGDGKYGKLCVDVNQITIPMLVSTFVDKNLNVQTISCGGNHTLVHAEPVENAYVNNSAQQIKSSDTLPPLRVVKKVIEERKENIEPFTSISAANGNDQEIIDIAKETAKEINTNNTIMVDQQIQVDKNYNKDNKPTEIENKNLENGEKISNMLVNSSSERKEKKVVNKSKYPRNERVRSRLCIII